MWGWAIDSLRNGGILSRKQHGTGKARRVSLVFPGGKPLAEISRQATIDASPEQLFRYVSDPYNAPNYISSITRIVSGPQGAAQDGQAWQAEANFLGQKRSVRLRLDEIRQPHFVRFSMAGDPPVSLSLHLTPEGKDKTQVNLTLDVANIPAIFLAGLMGGLLSADMSRLKEIMEK